MKFLRGVGHFRCFSESFISRTQSVINSVENVLWSCIFEEGKYTCIIFLTTVNTLHGCNTWIQNVLHNMVVRSERKKYEKNCPSGKMSDCTRMYQCVKNGCVF